jgi:Protein of unknown function (DUF3164)
MMSNTETRPAIPKGFWEDASGNLVPEAKIKPIDKDRHELVSQLAKKAKNVSADLLAYKLVVMDEVQRFVDRSMREYDAKPRGNKGNVTLISFDGRYKLQRAVAEHISFDERLQAAKSLIDECIKDWSKGSNANIKVLVSQAFQVDKEGKVSTGRVLGLRSLDITDEKWQRAMQAISDSITITGSKSYIRFYERDEATGEYVAIALDVAGV